MIGALLILLYPGEPFSVQKETAAEELMAALGERYLRPEHAALLERSDGTLQGAEAGSRYTPILCTYPLACGGEDVRPVWHRSFHGAFTSAEPLSHNIARSCPTLLRPDVLNSVSDRADRGG